MSTSWFKTMAAAIVVAAVTIAFAPSAWADQVSYLYPVYKTEGTPESGIREWRQGTVNATAYTGQAQIGGYGQTSWYVVRGTVFANSRITLLGDVNLILADGAVLTANQGITASVAVGPYKSFSVYAQSDDEGTMGRLVATSSNGNAAIGGCYSGMANGFGGFITINGGNVEATVMGQSGAAAIGGAPNGNGCDGYKITINGGKVTANAAFNNQPTGGAAIGGAGFVGRGMCTTGPSVNDFIVINGGTVIASAGMGAAAIGGGGGSCSVAGLAQDIYINGGRVKAQATCGSGTAYDDAIGNGRCSNNASALAQRIMIAASLKVVAAGAPISHADGQDISSILAHRGLVEVNWDDSQTEQSAAGGGTAQPSEPREPFKGIIAIPGMVEAENYDKGGEGFGYHDTDDENEGGEYRNDGVDIVKVGAGYAVGYTSEGEWLEYTVKVDEPGTYNIEACMANGSENSEIDLLLDGEFLTHITAEGAGDDDWDTYALGSSKAYLTAGEHTLRVTFTGDYANLDYLGFAKDVSAPGGEEPEVPVTPEDPETPAEPEELVLWEGKALVDEWNQTGNQPDLLVNGAEILRNAGAYVGQEIRFYVIPMGETNADGYDNWWCDIVEGGWNDVYVQRCGIGCYWDSDPNREEWDLDENGGYISFTLTQEMLDYACKRDVTAGTFVANGDDAMIIKITLVDPKPPVDPVDPEDPEDPEESVYPYQAGDEIVLWDGKAVADEWGDHPYFLQDAADLLKDAKACVGQTVRFYVATTDDSWGFDINRGDWEDTYASHCALGCWWEGEPNRTEWDLEAHGGYVDFTLTPAMLDFAETKEAWQSLFVVNGDNVVITKIALVVNGGEAPGVVEPEDPVDPEPQAIQIGDNVYLTLKDGVCTISGAGAISGDKRIGDYVDKDSITSLVIADGITEIAPRFFKKCYKLESVTGGKDLVSIGEGAFYLCARLATINLDCTTIPNGLDESVTYRTAIDSNSGAGYTIPAISVANHQRMLRGKKTLADAEWTDLGSPEGKNLFETGYNFFKIDLVAITSEIAADDVNGSEDSAAGTENMGADILDE